MSVLTNPLLSSIHASMLEREMLQARSLEELKRVAEKHGPYLMKKEKERLGGQYKARAIALAEEQS